MQDCDPVSLANRGWKEINQTLPHFPKALHRWIEVDYALMQFLGQPEYVHVMLHPMPVIGLLVAVLGLILGLIFKGKAAVTISMLLIAMTAGSAYFIYESGEGAEHRIEDTLDKESKGWLHEHEDRTDVAIYLFYVTAFVALAAVIMGPIIPGFARGMIWATLALACFSILAGGWIGRAGARINHPELRDQEVPLQPAPEETSYTDEQV
ncbi:MAG: hypothetical protein DRP71_11865 [Verrucomicrobia bacterium]|nr:MAG: hypothetical protein DRP71_11865 [Verrucomicrobiota bacterium]